MNLSIKDIQMKHNLGKICILFFLLSVLLSGNEKFSYVLTSNKKEALVHEAVHITVQLHQKDHTMRMFFFLQPQQSANYLIKLLHKTTRNEQEHNTSTTFEYLLIPKKAQQLTIPFTLTLKEATDEAITQIYTGGRDNVKWIESEDSNYSLHPLKLTISPLQQPNTLVGDFTLDTDLTKTTIKANASTSVIYTIKGVGYIPENLQLLHIKQQGVYIFADEEIRKSHPQADGIAITKRYTYTLSSDHNITLNPIILHGYNPQTKQYYTLTTPPHTIRVQPLHIQNFIDTKESPKHADTFEFSSHILTLLFEGFILFGSGFISGYLFKKRQKKQEKSTMRQFEDIIEAKTPKELLNLLLAYDHKGLEIYIQQLEDVVYTRKDKCDFQKLKKELYKHLSA